jgi:hypothetical protein
MTLTKLHTDMIEGLDDLIDGLDELDVGEMEGVYLPLEGNI